MKHIGLAEVNGRIGAAKEHMRKVNGCTAEEVDRDVEKAFRDWARRSRIDWKLDLSALGECKEVKT